MRYRTYSQTEIYQILHQTREIADKPYMLYVAFVLSCLSEVLESEDEDNEMPWSVDNIWGAALPYEVFTAIYTSAFTQFLDALQNGYPLDVWGKSISIRKAKSCNIDLLHNIFHFKGMYESGTEEVVIEQSRIYNVSNVLCSKEEQKDNWNYLRQVIYLAEDDDGWYKLTDMEVTMYLWAVFYKTQLKNTKAPNDPSAYSNFRAKYSEDLVTTYKEEHDCWIDGCKETNIPNTYFLFNASNVRDWNIKHHQESYVDAVSIDAATDYWYDKFFVWS